MHSPFWKQLRRSSATDFIYEQLDLSVCIPEFKQLRQKLYTSAVYGQPDVSLRLRSLFKIKALPSLHILWPTSSASVNNLACLSCTVMLKVGKTKLRGSFRPSLDQALPSIAALFYVLHSPYLRWLTQTSALHSPITHLSLLLLFQIIITIITSGIIYTRSDWHKLHTKASCKGIVNTMYNISIMLWWEALQNPGY